jgi:membrane protease YdiL (CAAX protease family)
MKRYPLSSFFIMTFCITWGLGAVYVLFGKQLEPFIGSVDHGHPLFFVAVYAPTISAILMVWRAHGKGGLKQFLKRYLHWGVGVWWYIFLVAFFIVMHFAIRWIDVLRGVSVPEIAYPWYMAVPMALMVLFTDAGPIGEELGWRGLALPLLQRRYRPLTAGIILGIIWGIWHLPAFFISGLAQSKLSFPLFMLFTVCLSIFITVVFNATSGSVPIAIVIHWFSNAGSTMNLRNFNEAGMICGSLILIIASIVIYNRIPSVTFKDPIPNW